MPVNDGIPFAELAHFELDRAAMQRLRRRFCEQWHVVVLGDWPDDANSPITVGMPDPRDHRVVDLVAHMLMREISPVRLNLYEIDKALDFGFQRRPLGEQSTGIPIPMKATVPDGASSAAALIEHVIRTAVSIDASDIHIENYMGDVDVRLRVDGVLRQLFSHINPSNIGTVVNRLKVMANLDITERRLPQDGRIRVILVDGDHRVPVELRVSTSPGPTGEDIVMRLVEQSTGVMPLSGLGMPEHVHDRLIELLQNPEGVIVVTGPTGSGKTSTLYAGIDQIRGDHRKIVTAENPVERFIPKVNQKQVGPKVGMATLARAFLRQDPDVMLIGEIRDQETAQVMSRAAITGHLVLSTLHTSDATAAVPRLRGLGLPAVDVADALLGIVAQRLVRRLCRHCKAPAPEDDPSTLRLKPILGDVSAMVPTGCEHCAHTGYAGRTGLFELIVVDDELASQIAAEVPAVHLRRFLQERGHRGLVDAARDAIEAGDTSAAEILRVIPARALSAMVAHRKATDEGASADA